MIKLWIFFQTQEPDDDEIPERIEEPERRGPPVRRGRRSLYVFENVCTLVWRFKSFWNFMFCFQAEDIRHMIAQILEEADVIVRPNRSQLTRFTDILRAQFATA